MPDKNSELEKVIEELVLACQSALLLRGLAAAMRDKLALIAERRICLSRCEEIEEQIRAAILKASHVKK